MIDKNLRIEISQEDGSILKSDNTGGLKVGVDKKRRRVIISAGSIDKSIYSLKSLGSPKQNKIILSIISLFILLYLIILSVVPNIYQPQKFLFSSVFILIASSIYSHFYKNYKLMLPILIIFIFVAAFVCEITPIEVLLKTLNNFK